MSIKLVSIACLLVAIAINSVDAQSLARRGSRRGAIAGAVVGGLIGGNNDRTALGIIAGGVGGALIGHAIGEQRDRQLFYQQQHVHPNYNSYPHPNAWSQGQYYQGSYNQPGYMQPSYLQPGYVQPGYVQPQFVPQSGNVQPPHQTYDSQSTPQTIYNQPSLPSDSTFDSDQMIEPPTIQAPRPQSNEPNQAWPHVTPPSPNSKSSSSSGSSVLEIESKPTDSPAAKSTGGTAQGAPSNNSSRTSTQNRENGACRRSIFNGRLGRVVSRATALSKLNFGDGLTSSPSTTPLTDGLEVHRTIQLDPNLKLLQSTTHMLPNDVRVRPELDGKQGITPTTNVNSISEPAGVTLEVSRPKIKTSTSAAQPYRHGW